MDTFKSCRAWLILTFAVLLLTGCAPHGPQPAGASVVDVLSRPPDAGFARAMTPMPFVFPQDHGPHPAYRTEWWYYTGNLTDARGQHYGYQLTFFRSALSATAPARASSRAATQVYMAHFALTSAPAAEHVSFERFSRGDGALAGATTAPDFAVWLENWSVRETAPGTQQLTATTQDADGNTFALDLTLVETRPPLLHGDAGLSQKGPEPGNASYYYSLVGLQTSGTLTWQDAAIPVTGVSWMDHEFGTSALSPNATGWDWFSLQLDNGMVLVLYQIRTQDGSLVPELTSTLSLPDHTQVPLTIEDFTAQSLATWTSPTTGTVYPARWTIRVPGYGIELTLEPIVDDQEMQTSFVYWEGAVTAQGTVDGAPVRGQGYVELTGYGGPAGDYQR